MKASISIRECGRNDIAVIRSIALTTWPVSYKAILSPAQLAYMLDLMYSIDALEEQFAKGHVFLLSMQGIRETGFAGFEHGYGVDRSTRLHKLYVLPEAQGCGAGSAMLRGVEDAARSAGDARLELNVNRFNMAKAWYEHRGFAVVRDEVIDIGHGFVMDDHVMAKALR